MHSLVQAEKLRDPNPRLRRPLPAAPPCGPSLNQGLSGSQVSAGRRHGDLCRDPIALESPGWGRGLGAASKLPRGSSVQPGLRTSFPEGINKEALAGRERMEQVGPLPSAGGPFALYSYAPRTQPHARPCTHARSEGPTLIHTHTHTPIHTVTDTHTHTARLLRASLAAGTPRLGWTPSMGSGPGSPRV